MNMGYIKRRVSCLFIISVMLVITQSKAFVYDIRVMRKWDNASGQYSYFVGLGDFHDKSHKITPIQVQQIDAIISRCDPGRTKFIVEDISSLSSSGKKCCNRFFINSTGGILGGLANKYRKKRNLLVDNVEYRFCRVASLAPVINNINANYRKFPSTNNISISAFGREIATVTKEILDYKDGKMLSNWYLRCLSQVAKHMNFLHFQSKLKMNIADYIYSCTNFTNRLSFVKKLLVFDSSLLDAKIVHSIIGPQGRQNAIVIAGGSHIRSVSRVLQTLGYQSIYNSKVSLRREYDTKRCLGSNITPGGFCRKPEPVDLRVIDRFL